MFGDKFVLADICEYIPGMLCMFMWYNGCIIAGWLGARAFPKGISDDEGHGPDTSSRTLGLEALALFVPRTASLQAFGTSLYAMFMHLSQAMK